MWMPGWTRNLIPRWGRWRRRAARRELFEPVRLSLRRLEDRRVLDVSASFMTGTGVLELDLANAGELATISNDNGDISVRDGNGNAVAIDVDGNGPGSVQVSSVQRLVARGDATADQGLVLATALTPSNGIHIESSVETATIQQPISQVSTGDLELDAGVIQLAADLEATGRDISFGGSVELANSVTLTASNMLFHRALDDDGDANSLSAVIVNAEGLTRFGGAVGSVNPIDSLYTDAAGTSEINADITASGNTIVFNDPVLLTNTVSISDSGATGIRFNNTVDSATGAHHSLTLTATNGQITFSGDIGNGTLGDQSLGQFTITEAATGVIFGDKAGVAQIRSNDSINIGSVTGGIGGVGVVFHGGNANLLTITTTGDDVRVNGASTLVTDLLIVTAGGNVTFTADAPVDSDPNTSSKLTIDAGAGAVSFNEDLGSQSALRGLEITRADAGVRFGGANAETAGGTGPVSRIRSTSPIDIGTGVNVIGGAGVVFDAGDGQTLLVTTTGDDVRINGAVELRSHLSINTGLTLGDITFTNVATINSEPGEQNQLTLNAGAASVLLNSDIGVRDALSALAVTRADAGVTIGTDANPVTLVRAFGGIDVGVGTTEIAGAGIVLNGGTGAIRLETSGADLRLNGPTTLASATELVTGAGPGDVILTNDSPVNSQAGEFNALTFDAGTGAVRVNEDLGRSNRLGALTVVSAAGGVVFGQAATEVPGSGSRGPVEVIQVGGPIDLGVGTNVIGGRGIVFQGSTGAGATVSTTDDNVRINGPTELASRLFISTGTGPGDVTFTSDAPVDGRAGASNELRIDAGTGSVTFNENLGETNPLGRLTIVRADGGVTFGSASSESSGPGGAGPVEMVRATEPIDIGAGANVIRGSGIIFNSGSPGRAMLIETSDDSVRLNGPTLLQSGIFIFTGFGGADILFTSDTTVDSANYPGGLPPVSANSLHLDAGSGSVSINADIGVQDRLYRLDIDRAAGGVTIGGADVATPGGLGPVRRIVASSIELGWFDSTITGGIVLNGGDDALTLSSALAVFGPTAIHSDLILEGGSIDFWHVSPLNSQIGESNDLRLTVAPGTGFASFSGPVGETSPLGEFRIVSADVVRFDQGVNAARIVQEAATSTFFGGAVTTTDPTLPGLDLTGGEFRFNGPVRAAGNGQVSIVHAGALTFDVGADLRIDGAFSERGTGTTWTAGNIITSGDAIHFGTPVRLTEAGMSEVVLDTTFDGNITGAPVTFDQEVISVLGDGGLTVNAGTGGNVTFSAAVGDSDDRLGQLRIVQAADVSFAGPLQVASLVQDAGHGTTTLSGPLDTDSFQGKEIDLNTTNVTLRGAINTARDGRVEITVSGILDIGPAANMMLAGSFLQDGTGTVATSADITTSNDAIVFQGNVVIRDNVSFVTGAGPGDLRFAGTVNGVVDCEQDVTIATGIGSVIFQSAVGGQVALGDVRIDNAGAVMYQSSALLCSFQQLAGTGETSFAGPLTIKSGTPLNLTTGSVTFHDLVDTTAGNAAVTIATADDVSINSEMQTGTGLVNLQVGGDLALGPLGSITTAGVNITITAGGDVFLADGSQIAAGAGAIDVTADGNITLGRLVTTTVITLTSTAGGIIDGGDAGGADVVAEQLALRAQAGIGTDNPIDTAISTLAASNETGGGVRVENNVGDALTIGTVDGLSGVRGGPLLSPALQGTVLERNNIELINVGAINVGNPGTANLSERILNHAGGHTILRAEFSGRTTPTDDFPDDLTINQPVQNRGGDGWIFLFTGGDLLINDSLPEFVNGDPTQQFSEAEISVEFEGAIRGEARGEVSVDNSPHSRMIRGQSVVDTTPGYAILRTHAERSIRQNNLTRLPAEFQDPTHYPPREDDPEFYRRLDEALRMIREEVAAQATNVAPIFSIDSVDRGGSDIDERGRGILEITIGDQYHLERNWHITVDWGDGVIESYTIPGNPEASRGFFTGDSSSTPINFGPDATITPRFDSGELVQGSRRPGVYYLHHTYRIIPNPDDPAAPIPVRAEARYDARAEGEHVLDLGRPADGSSIFNGIRFFANGTQEVFTSDNDVMTNPGAGVTFFIKVIESKIVPVEDRQVATVFITTTTTTTSAVTGSVQDFRPARFDTEAVEEYRLFMKVVDDVTGQEGQEEYELPIEVLVDPIGVFRKFKFPNGHYRIYLEEIRTGRVRLILDVHTYQGRIVPQDFREGTSERQPGSDTGESQTPATAPPGGMSQFDLERPATKLEVVAANPGLDVDTTNRLTASLADLAARPWPERVHKALESGERNLSLAAIRLRRLREE